MWGGSPSGLNKLFKANIQDLSGGGTQALEKFSFK